jgi:hypothetical protein
MTPEDLDTEELEFIVTLSGTYWRERPAYQIIIDGDLISQGEITAPSSAWGLPNESSVTEEERRASHQVISFRHRLSPGEHRLDIRLPEKAPDATVLKDGERVQDLLLTVEGVSIDGVDLSNLIHGLGTFHLDTPTLRHGQMIAKLENSTSMGYAGTWRMPFTSPFYMWLLERL